MVNAQKSTPFQNGLTQVSSYFHFILFTIELQI